MGLVTTLDTFSPLRLPGLIGWYDFSDLATLFTDTARTTAVTADAQNIKGVTDKSGNGNHLSQATTGPVFKQAIQRGKSISRYSGAANVVLKTSTPASTAQPYTAFIVGNFTANASTKVMLGSSITGEADALYASGTDGILHSNYNSVLTGSGSQVGAFHTFTSLANGASSAIRVDGTSNAAGAGGAGAMTGISVGSTFAEPAPMIGDIGEVIFYSGDKTVNYYLVEAYLRTKWGTA